MENNREEGVERDFTELERGDGGNDEGGKRDEGLERGH